MACHRWLEETTNPDHPDHDSHKPLSRATVSPANARARGPDPVNCGQPAGATAPPRLLARAL
eukprot:11187094-Lingulodinium_polyedra.AAC.1